MVKKADKIEKIKKRYKNGKGVINIEVQLLLDELGRIEKENEFIRFVNEVDDKASAYLIKAQREALEAYIKHLDGSLATFEDIHNTVIDQLGEEGDAIYNLIKRLRDHVAACGKSLTNKGKALRDEATKWLEENEHG